MRTKPLSLALALGIGLILITLYLFAEHPPVAQAQGPDGFEIYYVSPTGCGVQTPCYATIQAAVDAVDAPGDLIKVAGGTYTGVSARAGVTQTVYISKSLTIQGGYTTTSWTTPDPDANPTTLDALGQGRVLYITGDISPTIEGLRITGGDATGLGGLGGNDVGGGVIVYTATATISNCAIDNSTTGTAGLAGGGVFAHKAAVTLGGCAIHDNTSINGGGIYLNDSDGTTLSGNDIYNNMASFSLGLGLGGGVYANESDGVTLSGNDIYSNAASGFAGMGGGMYLASNDGITLSGNAIYNNVAAGLSCFGGGAYFLSSSARLDNNVIAGNQALGLAGLGGGVYVTASTADLRHNTLADNTGTDGNGVYVTDESGAYSSVAMTNTILFSHTVGISVTGGSTVTLQATLWYSNGVNIGGAGSIATSGDVTGDPVFVDPAAWDYHITTGSAALDGGVFAGVSDDFDGDARPTNPARPDAPDLGYDENKALAVRRPVSGTITFGAACARVVFTDTGGMTAITITVVPGRFPTTLPALDQVLSRTVTIEPSSSAAFSATLTLCYEDDEVWGGIGESSLALYRWTGSGWQGYPSSADAGNNVVTASGVADFSPWSIGDGNQTPTAVRLRAVVARSTPWALLLALAASAGTAAAVWLRRRKRCS